MYKVVVYYLKVDYNGLKIHIVNTRKATNKKVKDQPIVEIK